MIHCYISPHVIFDEGLHGRGREGGERGMEDVERERERERELIEPPELGAERQSGSRSSMRSYIFTCYRL